MNILCRECNINDYEQILPLFSQLWPVTPLNKGALKNVFTKGIRSVNQFYFCAENNGKIVGFCSLTVNNNLWQQGNLGHIDEIIVDTSTRGHGIGKELMYRVFQAARKLGCERIELDSAHGRTNANDFYERFGFKNRALVFSKILDNPQDNAPNELQDYLHRKIPQAHAMDVKVEGISPDGLTLSAPLEPNINHRNSVFGGSASSVAILAAWSFVHQRLRCEEISTTLVIQKNQMTYDIPILGRFSATASFKNPSDWLSFLNMLKKKGKARISVLARLLCNGQVAGIMDGVFVAVGVKYLQSDAARS